LRENELRWESRKNPSIEWNMLKIPQIDEKDPSRRE
jgi:hypothetical protein